MKCIGDISTSGQPWCIDRMIVPINPMSWYGGSQESPTRFGSGPMLRNSTSQLLIRLSCVRQTPFGDPVDPDVYWIRARSSGEHGSGRHRVGAGIQVLDEADQRMNVDALPAGAAVPRSGRRTSRR